MDRRKSIKLLISGVAAAPVLLSSCQPNDNEHKVKIDASKFTIDRNPDELKYENKLLAEANIFGEHEMKTITVLADIIIPKDDISGSASDAQVPAFIAFIVKDMPQHQIPMQGGLRWLDMQCFKFYNKAFIDCSTAQQLEMVDRIAFPAKAAASMSQGVQFFSLMRNLTATGFYTSKIGVEDIGYIGNTPTKWNGVPADVLAQYKISYSEKELKECVSFTS
ncbi:MAG: gluconate 2-dehydrogenase subunit 3 family protein [Chitinophagaceae bacterium]|nr:gluconate 2-dehydrogenase subunit 3 family protein [Chitinophagaceae bacterium]